MNLLVLGGAGYIGSHFVKSSLAQGHHVIIVDNLLTGHAESIPEEAKVYFEDIRDKAMMNQIFKENKIDAVVHFAASSLVAESMKDPMKYFDNNVYGTIVLLEMMAKHDVKKIVFSSSAATYGTHDEMPITENYDTHPESPYGETKLMMEKMMKWADVCHGIKYVSLRYFNVAGASSDATIGEDHRPETHLIPIILQVPLEKRDHITIFGNDYKTFDGTCIRDYIHVEDLVDAHLKALEYLQKGNDSEIFNLGSETGYSNLQILKSAREVTKHPVPMEFGDRRPGDPDSLVATYKKAEKILGWKPKKDIKEIIKTAWGFHKDHPNGYEE